MIGLKDDTYPLVLAGDETKPEDQRPQFICRFLSFREFRAYLRLVEQAQAAQKAKSDEDLDLAEKAIAMAVVDVVNADVPTWENSRGKVLDVVGRLTFQEFWELVWKIPATQNLTVADKKKSSSAPPSDGENSVPGAKTNAEPVPTPA